jgi:hypothetical protein
MVNDGLTATLHLLELKTCWWLVSALSCLTEDSGTSDLVIAVTEKGKAQFQFYTNENNHGC